MSIKIQLIASKNCHIPYTFVLNNPYNFAHNFFITKYKEMFMEQTARLFLTGSSLYPAIELLYRKKTHISMAFAGGTSLCLIDKICNDLLKHKRLPSKCVVGSFIITGVELITGLIVNIFMKKHVWDYSNLPMNIKGQICIPFTVIWGLLTIPALMVCNLIKHR